MFKKILLLICIAFVVVCYGYPFFTLPFGEYKGEIGSGESKVEVSLKLEFNGTATTKVGETETEYNYKFSKGKLILSLDDEFDNEDDVKLDINSMYELDSDVAILDCKLVNNVGMYMAIGVGVLAIILVLLPSKR